MIRRHVLAALDAGITAGEEDAARASLARIDWLLRRRARWRLEQALIDAALVSGEFAPGDVEGARHVQRVAALALRRTPAAEPTDRAAVAAAYGSVAAPRPARAPTATIAGALVATAAIAGVAGYIATRPGPAARSYQRPLAPPSAGAFRDGGVPLRDPALEAVLTGPLMDLLLAVDHPDAPDSDARHRRLIAALRAEPTLAAHGEPLASAWRDLLDDLDHWPEHSAERLSHAAGNVLRVSARSFSDRLAAAGLGYLVEGDALYGGETAQAALYVYRVEEVVFVKAGGVPRRVVSLRRIDHLNLVHTVLGMHSEELADPMLLLDQIDQHVATQVLPVLAPEAAFPLADTPWSATATARAFAAAAGAAIRAELLSALGADASAATRIAALLHERADLVESWRDTLERHHLRMIATDELFLPAGLLDQLDGLVPRYQHERVAAIEDELANLDGPRIASRCHALVAATVRRHEAEHGFDADRAAPLRYPPALEAETGDIHDRNGEPRWLVLHTRNELSAWLSQIANDPKIPELVIWDLASHAFSRPRWGTPESYVAIVVLEGLARHLGGNDHAPVIHDGAIDRDRLAAVATPIARASDADLRVAASALWTELYSEPLTAITDR
ncbi:MAG TPA: hypothetical protein VHN14_01670 [Kofleriaceae bacterium]|nr:hypothetical protein [Kofleriaceae bacterium]